MTMKVQVAVIPEMPPGELYTVEPGSPTAEALGIDEDAFLILVPDEAMAEFVLRVAREFAEYIRTVAAVEAEAERLIPLLDAIDEMPRREG